MNAIVKEKPGEDGTFFRENVKEPEPGDGQVKVKVMAASICGSDVHALFSGAMADRYDYPVIIGHEGAGEVVSVGRGVKSIKAGDRVTAETTLEACGTCEYCRQSMTNMCENRKGLGSKANGYFAQYCIVAEKACHKLSDDVSYEVGSLAEPFTCATHAVLYLSNPKPGDVVLVSGPGPIGTMVAAIAHLAGCVVVLSGITADKDRLAFAKKHYKIQHTVDSMKTNLKDYVAKLTEGRGADIVYECSGSKPGILSGLDVCKRKGMFVAVGMNMGEIPLDYYNIIYKKEITIQGDKSTSSISWVRSMRIINSGLIDLNPIITHKIPMSEWKKGYDLARKGEAVKVVMLPWSKK